MSLFLVQHGKNLPKDVDPDKGLSDAGKKEVERVATQAAKRGLRLAAIKHSGKKRARETAEIFARHLEPAGGVEEMDGLGPLDDVTAAHLEAGDNLMLVGHLPFMEKLTSYLVAASSDRPPVLMFQNGGIACLDQDPETDSWHIKWTLFPRIE
jgi:phosphohistidine phosphatase